MSVNDGEKIFDKHFSPETGLIDKQKTVLTKGATIFRRNDRQMSINAQWSNKKKLFEKKSLQNIPMDTWWAILTTLSIVFRKKALIFWLKVRKVYIKQTKVCQNGLKSSNWSLGPVDCSVVNLAGKSSNKDWLFCDQCPKMMGKKILDKSFFTTHWSIWQAENSTENGTDKFP